MYSIQFAPVLTSAAIILSVILSLTPYFSSLAYQILLNSLPEITRENLLSSQVLLVVIMFASVVTLRELLLTLAALVGKNWGFKLSEEFEALTLAKKIKIDIATHENPNFQNLMQRAFNRGLAPLVDLTQHNFEMIRLVVSFILGSAIAWNISFPAYIIVTVASIPQLIIHLKYGIGIWNIRAVNSPEQRKFSELVKLFKNTPGIIETKLFQTGPELINRVRQIMQDFHNKQSNFEKKKVWLSLGAELLFFIGNSISLFLILQLFIQQSWKPGDLIFAVITFTATGSSIRELFLYIHKQNEEHLSVRDLLEFLNTPTGEVKAGLSNLDLHRAPDVTFDHVWFKYPGTDKWALQDVCFTLCGNQRLAVIGPNGSGKSTIVRLLCKIYEPTSGKIYVNGQDLSTIDIQYWWSLLAVMPQDFVDYTFTVEHAIAMGNIDKPIDHSRIVKSAALSRANEFIEKWAEKYNTQLGAMFGGQTPSRGQRQKISLSKTIYRCSHIKILDEPTSSMDIESVQHIASNLPEISGERPLLLISHNVVLTKACDKILIVENGKITGHGSHAEMLSHKYYQTIS